jgi:dTDP-4-amino-4,6-dideoxygalactose transaminase
VDTWDVPLADLSIEDEDLEAVEATYRSGWLTLGPRTATFERRFAQYTGAAEAVAVSSGTAALHLACLTAGLGAGDEVIVPSLTFVATVNAVAYTGATPVFADIAGVTEPWLSAEACERVVTERTRAVLAVDYGGHAGEIEALAALCRRHGLVLLEDAAHAAGARVHGRHLGTLGAAGAFSLFSNKNLAVGEGGVLVTSDPDVAARARLLRSHGMTTLTWDRHRGHASDYDVTALGFNYRLDEARAAMATTRLARLDRDNARRARLVDRYRQALIGLDLQVAMPPAPGLRSSHHLFTIVLPPDVDRAAFRRRLAERRIQTSVHYPAAHRFALYAGDHDLTVTEAYAARSVTLPLFPHLTDAQQDRVVEATRAGLNRSPIPAGASSTSRRRLHRSTAGG